VLFIGALQPAKAFAYPDIASGKIRRVCDQHRVSGRVSAEGEALPTHPVPDRAPAGASGEGPRSAPGRDHDADVDRRLTRLSGFTRALARGGMQARLSVERAITDIPPGAQGSLSPAGSRLGGAPPRTDLVRGHRGSAPPRQGLFRVLDLEARMGPPAAAA
jgi:hypothetical protein